MGLFIDQAKGFLDLLTKFNTRLKNGYLQFFDSVKGRWEWVHRKVAEIKTGIPIPWGHEVHHKNRDKLDNDPENLEVLSEEDHKKIHKSDYSDRINRINKKLSDIKKKVSQSEGSQKSNTIHSQLERIISSERMRVDNLFNKFQLSGLDEISCSRCGGSGHLPQYNHVSGGVCFLCGGSGAINSSSFEDFEPDNYFDEDDWGDYDFGRYDDYY